MSGINFNSWTENATRLGMRIQETLAERTKDFSLTSNGAGYYDAGEDKTKNIKTHLDSGSEREKLEVMKRLIAVSVSQPSVFFARHPVRRVPDDLKRPQRIRVLRASGQERRVTELGSPEARVHLSAALRRSGTGPGAALHQHVPTRSRGRFAADTCDGLARSVWHPCADHCQLGSVGDQEMCRGYEPIRTQDGGTVDTEMLQVCDCISPRHGGITVFLEKEADKGSVIV